MNPYFAAPAYEDNPWTQLVDLSSSHVSTAMDTLFKLYKQKIATWHFCFSHHLNEMEEFTL